MNNKKSPNRAPLVLPGGALDFSRPLVMSIVNCTNDSFYKESRTPGGEAACGRALEAAEAGADIIDFGAESSRPGAAYVDEETELARLIPAVKRFRKYSSLPVSVDTRKVNTARIALDEGADIINDISCNPALAVLAAKTGAALVVMHMKGEPKTMQEDPVYDDPVAEVQSFLKAAVQRALDSGVPPQKIILDPGIGFGKKTADNIALLRGLDEIRFGDYPLLVGLSRKSFIGDITGRPVSERLAGTLAAGAVALASGADILRVHDSAETADLIKIWRACAA
ncbi:MAG: dihydropteroate synthase [Treponema sp.]|nr:dihydropteroate synthase [Treponema sp.]